MKVLTNTDELLFRPAGQALFLVAVTVLLAGCNPQEPSARFLKQIDWVGRGEWIKVDTHIHSRFSDGNHSISEIAQKAVEFRCDAIAVTDHADQNRKAATAEYFEEIQAARWQFPSLMILAGIEWNVPPFGGDEHATVLVPEDLETDLAEFKSEFDDYQRSEHSPQRAAAGLQWLQSRTQSDGSAPVVFLEHPSRQCASSLEVATTLKQIRDVSDVVVGMSGAPGHQAGEPNGSYSGTERTVDRWDPAVARVGDSWDQMLLAGFDIWGSSAPSDFHRADATDWNDYWPGQFSETWAYVPERSASGLLRAFRAGSFFGAHGQIAREVDLDVDVGGLTRPAHAGEIIETHPSAVMTVAIHCRTPEKDWAGNTNRIDEIELIAVTAEGVSVVASVKPDPSGVTHLISSMVPDSGCVLRARGRRVVPDGPDLLFHTNPVRIVVARSMLLGWVSGLGRSSMRQWGGTGLGLFALLTLLCNRRKPKRKPTPVKPIQIRTSRSRAPRYWFLGMAFAFGLFAIYGSLLPFRFQSLSLAEAWSRFLEFRAIPTSNSGRVDFLVNAMLFVPIGFGLMASTGARWNQPYRSLVLAIVFLVLTGLLSIAIEFAQVWLPSRISSVSDIAAQLAGAAAGMIGWLLTGTTIDSWTATFLTTKRPLQRAEMVLRVYFIAILFISLIPLDLTIHPNDLWDKFQAGKIVLVPFQGFQWSSQSVFETLLKGLVAVPMGMLAVTLSSGASYPTLRAMFLTVILVAAIEVAQLFVESRFSSMTDVLVGAMGGLIGVWIGRLNPVESTSRLTKSDRSRFRGLLAAAYLVFPCCVLWWPLNFSADPSMIKAKLQRLTDVPLNQLILGQNYWRGVSQITERILLFLPFGVLVGAWLADGPAALRGHSRVTLVVGVLVVLAAALIIEAGQVVVPDRIPDVADVLLAVAGGVAGLMSYRLVCGQETQDEFRA